MKDAKFSHLTAEQEVEISAFCAKAEKQHKQQIDYEVEKEMRKEATAPETTVPEPVKPEKKKKTSADDDTFDVDSYDDAEEFYFYNFDDFFDYYDAEDYYNEHKGEGK